MRSSLQFSNTSCEQLEQKVEELEHSNKQLQKLCNIQQTLLAQKTSTFVDLQKDFARLKCQHEQLLQVKMTVEETDAGGFEAEQKRRSKNLKSDDGGKPLSIGDGSDVAELQSSMAELAQSVQNITFQKQKVESELEEVVNDNQSLVKALERADSEIVELQTRLRNVEENSLDLTSPKSRSCPLTDTQQFSPSNDPKSPLTLHKACKSPRKSGSDQDACLSLFSELDIQYSTLQQRYCELVEQCTCSASLFHKKWFPSKPENPPTNVQMVTDAPFKELFDEVFATLKQTSLVADKLIERKNTAK